MNTISKLIQKTESEITRLKRSIELFGEAGAHWAFTNRKIVRRTVRRLNRKEKLLSILKTLNK